MADAHSAENGTHKKKAAPPLPPRPTKRIKIDDDHPSQANPSTMEAVRDRNRAMELEMQEKNRRIKFLTHKCESLFRRRAVTDAQFRAIRRQWLQLLDDLETSLCVLHEAAGDDEQQQKTARTWQEVVAAADLFGVPRSRNVKLVLPEWFIALNRGEEDVALPDASDDGEDQKDVMAELPEVERELAKQLQTKYEQTKALAEQILSTAARIQQFQGSDEKAIEFQHFVEEKRALVADVLTLKEKCLVYKRHMFELERDIEVKEFERHKACRDYDRLTKFVECNRETLTKKEGDESTEIKQEARSDDAHDKKTTVNDEKSKKEQDLEQMTATLRENVSILSTKLYQERDKNIAMTKEIQNLKAQEQAWKVAEAHLKQESEDKIQHLREENTNLTEEFTKLRHKVKDMENHVNAKWKKKMAKIQADMTKVKTQMDELNIKNTTLREKLSSTSSIRDQLVDLKAVHEASVREIEGLKGKLDSAVKRAERLEKAAGAEEAKKLSVQLEASEKVRAELQATYDELKASISDKPDVSKLMQRQTDLESKYEQLLLDHGNARTNIEKLEAELEDMRAAHEASREENDALVSEIEILNKDIEAARHAKKKAQQQLEEKRTSCKKLHTQLAKEEQAKSHCFEELAAARLQVSSLGTVHKHQKATLESVKEALQAKQRELEALHEYVKNLMSEKEAADSEKRKVLCEAEVVKHMYTASSVETSQKQQQEKKRPCEKCEQYRLKEEQNEKLLQAAKAAGSSGGLTDLERFELQDLQKVVNCSVCQDRRKTVIITKCSHMFCKECIDSNIKARNRKCPTCKKMFGQDDIKNVWFT